MPLADARPTERTLTDEQSMHRRSFLAGIATTLLAGTTAARAAPELYGRSRIMDALPDWRAWNAAQLSRIRSELGAFGNASWITHNDGHIESVNLVAMLQRHPEMTAGQMIDANRRTLREPATC